MADHLCLTCRHGLDPPQVDRLGWPLCGMPEPDASVKLPHYALRRYFERQPAEEADALVTCNMNEAESLG